jgi:cytochrome c oxidase subunit 3
LPNGIAAHADEHGPPHAHHPAHQHHFETMEQQLEASTLGMWIFLVTEVMFFGGLFTAYLVYRVWYPQAWSEGSLELDIRLGGFNTVVLIGSSLTMAFAVRAAQTAWRRGTIWYLVGTMLLGLTFLVVKFFEYRDKYLHNHIPGANFHFEGPHADQVEIFLALYFAMTVSTLRTWSLDSAS